LAFAAGGAGQAATMAGDQAKAQAAKATIFRIIDRRPPIDTRPWNEDKQERLVESLKLSFAIEGRQLRFAYPSRADAPVFNDLSLEIKPGQTAAIIGTSGHFS